MSNIYIIRPTIASVIVKPFFLEVSRGARAPYRPPGSAQAVDHRVACLSHTRSHAKTLGGGGLVSAMAARGAF